VKESRFALMKRRLLQTPFLDLGDICLAGRHPTLL
jgi:hypothetical protein